MSFLNDLTAGTPPPNVNSTYGSISSQPDWYQEMLQGIAARSAQVAGQGYQYYSDPRLAGFTGDQNNAFQAIRNNQGSWQPAYQSGMSAMGQVQPYGQQATGAVSGPAQTWTGNWQQYMSPYTQSVVNEIGRLGNQNLNENILPGINNSFIGNGAFGSDRNADMIGRGIRDAETNIAGLQSQALEQGYGTSAGIFANDAARQQQQQQMQANTALGAGSQALQAGYGYGALGQMGQQMGYNDASQLYGAGAQQQGLQQKGYDIGYGEFQNQVQYPWQQLDNMSTLLQRMQVPTTQTGQTNAPLPGSTYGASPIATVGGALGALAPYFSNTDGG
jgi:hypothetical protein